MRKHKYKEKQWSEEGYFFDLLYQEIILDSSMVERTAVNRDVVGSSPTRGADEKFSDEGLRTFFNKRTYLRKEKQ